MRLYIGWCTRCDSICEYDLRGGRCQAQLWEGDESFKCGYPATALEPLDEPRQALVAAYRLGGWAAAAVMYRQTGGRDAWRP